MSKRRKWVYPQVESGRVGSIYNGTDINARCLLGNSLRKLGAELANEWDVHKKKLRVYTQLPFPAFPCLPPFSFSFYLHFNIFSRSRLRNPPRTQLRELMTLPQSPWDGKSPPHSPSRSLWRLGSAPWAPRISTTLAPWTLTPSASRLPCPHLCLRQSAVRPSNFGTSGLAAVFAYTQICLPYPTWPFFKIKLSTRDWRNNSEQIQFWKVYIAISIYAVDAMTASAITEWRRYCSHSIIKSILCKA